METIELFLQGEGIAQIALVEVRADGTVRAIVEAAQAAGLPADDDGAVIVLIEGGDESLALDVSLRDAGVAHHSRVHVHRCQHVAVSVHHGPRTESKSFRPGTTIGHVKAWADEAFAIGAVDAAALSLQVSGTDGRPDGDTHIGALVRYPHCALGFDLVYKQRVEG